MKIHNLMIILLSAATMNILGGCASIVGSHVDSVTVETPYCPGATCLLSNEEGKYFITETPGTVTVERAYGDLTIACEKDNAKKIIIVESTATGGVWGNILAGGVIGWGVDVATGAGYAYPSSIINPLKCE